MRRVRSGEVGFGLALIGVGALFLLRNYLGVPLGNWWAAFILIPAFASFWAAWTAWRLTGLGYAATGPFTGGLVLLAVALIFLLELEWGRIWPVFLLILGFGALLPSLLRARGRSHDDNTASRA